MTKLFARFFAPRKTNLTTALERQRLAKTMPGQTGAVAAARLGILAWTASQSLYRSRPSWVPGRPVIFCEAIRPAATRRRYAAARPALCHLRPLWRPCRKYSCSTSLQPIDTARFS